MLVYRIEHSVTNRGPYNPFHSDPQTGVAIVPEPITDEQARLLRDAANWLQAAHSDGNRPTPVADGIPLAPLVTRSDWRCGFRTIADAHAWFTTDLLLRLRRLGYVFAAYDVPDDYCLEGEHQVVFLPCTETRRYVRP